MCKQTSCLAGGRSGGKEKTWTLGDYLPRLCVVINVLAAVGLFVVSIYSLVKIYKGSLNRVTLQLVLLGCLLLGSAVYFCITIVNGITDCVDTTRKSKKSNSFASVESSCDGLEGKGDQHNMDYPEVVVVGAGTSGATLAVTLARQGRKVWLLEKCMKEQDRIVGELLQPGGLRGLERLGLDSCAKEGVDSVVVHGYAVIRPSESNLSESGLGLCPKECKGEKDVLLYYPETDPGNSKDFFGRGVVAKAGPEGEGGKGIDGAQEWCGDGVPRGRSFHNCRFVQRLREVAMNEPNIRVVEATVTRLLEKDGVVLGVEYKEAVPTGAEDGEERATKEVKAPLTVVADGIWSGLRKCANTIKPQKASTFVGVLVTHPADKAPVPYRHCGHVILAHPSPMLIYQISSTETRVLVDVAGRMPNAASGELAVHLREKAAPQLPKGFRTAFLEAVERGDIKSMPNRSLPASGAHCPGAVLIGDALNMRHPLTGGGMTVAIKDVELLSCLLRGVDLCDRKAVAGAVSSFHSKRKGHAATINILANALYQVFSTPEQGEGKETRSNLQSACFDYLGLGGCYSAGPVGLLAGLTPHPWVLTTHFFMVAGYGVKSYLMPLPTLNGFVRMYRLLHVATMIIMPLLAEERSTPLAWWPVRKLVQILLPWEHMQAMA
ncbi:unnamed protein product [Choristocarpus tenellus]